MGSDENTKTIQFRALPLVLPGVQQHTAIHEANCKPRLRLHPSSILWYVFIMLFRNIFPLLALVSLVASSPSVSRPIPPKEDMRLVKISEDDAGVWVTEEEKFTKFISKHVNFVDVTETWELESLAAAKNIGKRASSFPSGPTHQSVAAPLISALSQSKLESWTTTMTNYYNRYYKSSYGTQAATWMYNTVKSVAAANSAITVSQFKHSYSQPSVIAKIPGTSGASVIVSAHFDSIGSTTSGRAPGADDNASGIVVILEALRVLANAKFTPTNTLEFHFYSGEEGGLLGSRDVMNSYVKNGVNVKALMNQDMTGYSPNNVIAVYTDYVSTPLTNFMKTLVPVYTDLPLSTDECGYGCSDHASANSAGYPAAYVCDENMKDSSPYIHSANDALSTLSFPHMLQHAKFTVGFLVEGSYF